MGKLRYVPHAAARHLASRKTRVIGLLLNNLHNDFFVPLLNGVEAVVRKKGYNLIVATYHANSRDKSQPPIGPHNTDGLLIFSDGLVDEELASPAGGTAGDTGVVPRVQHIFVRRVFVAGTHGKLVTVEFSQRNHA